MDNSFPNDTTPFPTWSLDVVYDDYNLTENTSSPTSFMATPFQTITPFAASEDVDIETHYTITPPAQIATPQQSIVPFAASNNTDVENNNEEKCHGIMVTPQRATVPLIASNHVDVERQNTEQASVPMVTPQRAIVPFAAFENVDIKTHNTESSHTPMISPLAIIPFASSYGVDVPFTSSGCANVYETHDTVTSLPLMVTPLQAIIPFGDYNNEHSYASDAGPSTLLIKRGRGRPKGSKNKNPSTNPKKQKTYKPESKIIASCSGFESGITEEERENGNDELVDMVLMRFDAVRRRLCQLGVQGLLTTALTNCRNLGVMTNTKKRIGPIPGVQVGDIYYFWGEMCLIGLHTQMVAGIDYLTAKHGAIDGPLASSVVTSGHYDDESYEFDTLVYTGHGGTQKNGEPRDQKLERGNFALEKSKEKGNDVRVIRGEIDPNDKKKKIYVYDGLYNVSDHWKAKGKSGFDVFKYRLVRKPGQPSGYATWKMVEKWRKEGMSNLREGLLVHDISLGTELIPVPVVNELDFNDKEVPEDFQYARFLYYSRTKLDLTDDRDSSGCNCKSCFTEDVDCDCVWKNRGELPYVNRILVCRKANVYECGDSCKCMMDCKNRVLQLGLKIHVEVFKTKNCGWGVRSWEPIRAGTFICEFAGQIKTQHELEEDDDYIFDSFRVYNSFKWNFEHQLCDEDLENQVLEDYNLPSQILISAKRYGNVGRFLNHSCCPNVFWQPVGCELNGERYFRVGFFAMKHIPPFTELTYDYGVSQIVEELGENGNPVLRGKKVCLCGSIKCRGFFG